MKNKISNITEKVNAVLPIIIERFNLEIPYTYGKLNRIEFKTTGSEKVTHSWLVLHGLKTGAGEPLTIHLGRVVNAL